MSDNVATILGLALAAAVAIPLLWMIWAILKKVKTNRRTTGQPPERGEAEPRD